MLVHNLPIAASNIQDGIGEIGRSKPGHIPLVPLGKARAALLWLDLLAVTAATWPILAQAGTLPGTLALLAIAAAWWAGSDRLAIYGNAQLDNAKGLTWSAALCSVLGGGVLLFAAMFEAAGGDHAGWLALRYTMPLAACIVITRVVWWTVLRSLLADGFCIERVIVLAENTSAARIVAARFERLTSGRLRAAICGILPVSRTAPDIANITDLITSRGATRVVVSMDGIDHAGQDEFLAALVALPVGVSIIWRGNVIANTGCVDAALRNSTLPDHAIGAAEQAVKRLMDITIAILVLALVSPILTGIALAIRFDSPGPAIFRQKRVGKDAALFNIWKFRTMYDHLRDDAGNRQTGRNDHRITRIGAMLRRTSLDELPQVINVLRGQMSIVGPRPHTLGMTVDGVGLDTILPTYNLRHRVKPGITGWAQINGCRGELTTFRSVKRRVALDCHYIDNWSIGLDAKIILRTASLIIRDRHAY